MRSTSCMAGDVDDRLVALPMSYVDHAELVWRKLKDARQQAVADELGLLEEALEAMAGPENATAMEWFGGYAVAERVA